MSGQEKMALKTDGDVLKKIWYDFLSKLKIAKDQSEENIILQQRSGQKDVNAYSDEFDKARIARNVGENDQVFESVENVEKEENGERKEKREKREREETRENVEKRERSKRIYMDLTGICLEYMCGHLKENTFDYIWCVNEHGCF